ncbi:MAG: hypothetical protein ACREI3_04535 [Nitrospirales bacterium]
MNHGTAIPNIRRGASGGPQFVGPRPFDSLARHPHRIVASEARKADVR